MFQELLSVFLKLEYFSFSDWTIYQDENWSQAHTMEIYLFLHLINCIAQI